MIEVGLLFIVLALIFRSGNSGLSYVWLDQFLQRQEDRFNRRVWIIGLSVLLLLAACFYIRLDLETNFLGYHYAKLSENPFAFDLNNSIQYRILTPLISYCLGLRGKLIIVTNLLITGVTIGTIYSYFRNRFERPGDAFLAVVTVSSSLVILTSIHCGGYCDILTYLIIFLMWQHRSKRTLFYCLFLLGLLNRESILFLVPWFAYLNLQGQTDKKGKRGKYLELLVGFGLAMLLYYSFRNWVASDATVQFSLGYYLEPLTQKPLGMYRRTFLFHGLGFFSIFKALWIFPALAAWSFWKDNNKSELVGMGLLLFCAYAQMLIAYDTSRMLTLCFMIMIISLCHLMETNRFRFREWAFGAVAFNLLIPQIYTADKIIEIWHSFLTTIIS